MKVSNKYTRGQFILVLVGVYSSSIVQKCTQWMPIAVMEVFDLWMVIELMKEELSCAAMEYGHPSWILVGITVMLKWCAGNWDTLIYVRMHAKRVEEYCVRRMVGMMISSLRKDWCDLAFYRGSSHF